jgi:predicted O-methyltransferase YrrM
VSGYPHRAGQLRLTFPAYPEQFMAQQMPPTLDDYIDGASPATDALLARLEQQAAAQDIPIIGRPGAALICLLTRIARPTLHVELGTATGYSAIWLLRGWPKARLITFELDDVRAAQARENLAAAGLAKRAEVRVENAIEGLAQLPSGSADIVFNDVLNGLRDKRRVELCFQSAMRVLKPGGLLLADNALGAGEVLRAETREARCVHRWNQLVSEEESLSATIVPVGDGLSIAVRRAALGP